MKLAIIAFIALLCVALLTGAVQAEKCVNEGNDGDPCRTNNDCCHQKCGSRRKCKNYSQILQLQNFFNEFI